MSQTYELNKKINDLLPKVAQRHDLKIEIESEYIIDYNSEICSLQYELDYDRYGQPYLIQSQQIRQILNALKGVLTPKDMYLENGKLKNYPSKSISLCNRWLDGLTPLIDQSPETVLSELVDVLNQLLN